MGGRVMGCDLGGSPVRALYPPCPPAVSRLSQLCRLTSSMDAPQKEPDSEDWDDQAPITWDDLAMLEEDMEDPGAAPLPSTVLVAISP